MPASLLVIGSVAYDTLHLPTGSFPKVLGGAAMYGSVAASYYAKPRLVGVVGKDFPDANVSKLRSRGIDVSGLEVADGETFHWEGRYAPDLTSRDTLRTDLNVFASFSPKLPDAWLDSELVMLGNIAPELQIEVLDRLRKPRFVLADTMNFWIDSKRDVLLSLLARVDLIVINEEEARQLTGEHHIAKVARALRAIGPKHAIVKRGEYGAMLFGPSGVFSAAGYPLESVIDPTGAGDCFAGGLLGYLASQGDVTEDNLRRAVVYGSAIASFDVEGVGPSRLFEVSKEDVESRVADFRKMVAFGA